MNNNQLPENITQENYELIMFNLVEGLYDASTEKQLLQQINNDPLFSFEWEQWQKSRIEQIEFPDLGDEAYWNSVKGITKTQPQKTIALWSNKKMLRIAAVLLPLLIAGVLLWLNSGDKAGKNSVVNTVKKEGVNTLIETSPEQTAQGNILIDRGVKQSNTTYVNTAGEVIKNSLDTTPEKTITPKVIAPEIQQAPVIVKSEQAPAAKKKRFNVMVSNIAPQPAQTASLASEKPKKLSNLFTNPQIRKYKTESGEVWIEISGDGGSVYAKAAESIEK